jgi:hypothetical protein
MKKSQLRNIIRESIKELITEQSQTTHMFSPCATPWVYGPVIWSNAPGIQSHPLQTIIPNSVCGGCLGPAQLGGYGGNPNITDPVAYYQAVSDYSNAFYQAAGSPQTGQYFEIDYGGNNTMKWKYEGQFSSNSQGYLVPIHYYGATHPYYFNNTQTINLTFNSIISCTNTSSSTYKCAEDKQPGVHSCQVVTDPNNPGPYSTLQACQADNSNIPNGCGGGASGGQTIECYKCKNGYPVANIFQGLTCPPGWVPASHGDPCKTPPTNPDLQYKITDPTPPKPITPKPDPTPAGPWPPPIPAGPE